jgi:hypothetical protein
LKIRLIGKVHLILNNASLILGNEMDYEDTERILNQMWEQGKEHFIEWIKKNQSKILEYLAFEKDD